ncbi:hypothetical protein E5358_12775 [Palleniella muris]|uniref:Uncharacterized protein n=1 Tax=Palleniella muris TaxID=3038145 RepID=A0AC61QME1_9BACT|nr:hypothetical protein [Palleniella muris]TGX80524.1 hypothetical protein E5358_12775 [Palleniella muris]
MINKGDRVTVKISRDLLIMGLGPLIGKGGVVTQPMTKHKTPGAMVKVDEKFMDYSLWFIPIKSISVNKTNSRQNKIKMLKEAVL